jgi:uncharacterized protein YqjF (DUF2071 family)
MTQPSDLERLRMRSKPSSLPVMRQQWRQLAFLHWSVDPLALTSLLPPGLQVDTWRGQAFVGLVPFAVRGARAPFLPPVPGLANFNELNFRTYVHREGRDPGVWFFSLDASSQLAVWGARIAYKLPYFHASIAMTQSKDGVTAFSSKRTGSRLRFACAYEGSPDPVEAIPGTLEFFLIERYLLYSWDRRYLTSARVWHRPYRIAGATIHELTEDLSAGTAFERPADRPCLAHYCDGVDVRIYRPTLVRQLLSKLMPSAAAAPPIRSTA